MGELPLADIDLSLLAHSGGETATNTLNRGKGVDDLLLAINVGVEDTKNVLELSLVNKTLQETVRHTNVRCDAERNHIPCYSLVNCAKNNRYNHESNDARTAGIERTVKATHSALIATLFVRVNTAKDNKHDSIEYI